MKHERSCRSHSWQPEVSIPEELRACIHSCPQVFPICLQLFKLTVGHYSRTYNCIINQIQGSFFWPWFVVYLHDINIYHKMLSGTNMGCRGLTWVANSWLQSTHSRFEAQITQCEYIDSNKTLRFKILLKIQFCLKLCVRKPLLLPSCSIKSGFAKFENKMVLNPSNWWLAIGWCRTPSILNP